MRPITFFTLFLIIPIAILAQDEVMLSANDLQLYGTLLTPDSPTNKAILIISGSGQTDRDGNSKPGYINNSLKKLAELLQKEGFAVLRYDKRSVGKSISDSLKVENLRFEQYAADASLWITFLKNKYKDITVIGHSQGALVAMLAIQNNNVDRFISLAGLSEDAYTTVKRQLANQPEFVKNDSYPILDSLRIGIKVDSIPQYLYSLFNPKIQDYFISFMKYDPREEIKKLTCPIMIIQGSADIQITVEGATQLSEETPFSTLKIIDGMNHVLRKSSTDAAENMATYSNPDLPLHEDLIEVLLNFIKQSK